jgi:hypothetical protein
MTYKYYPPFSISGDNIVDSRLIPVCKVSNVKDFIYELEKIPFVSEYDQDEIDYLREENDELRSEIEYLEDEIDDLRQKD